MRGLAFVALAALSLAACASSEPVSTATPIAVAAGPAPVAGYDWHFHEDGEEARIAYGLEASDDLRLGLACAPGSGRLDLSAIAPKGSPSEIHLESGGDTERYPAKAEPSEVNDGLFLTASARASDPVFLRFRRTGWMAVWTGERRDAYAAHPQNVGDIERFFAACG